MASTQKSCSILTASTGLALMLSSLLLSSNVMAADTYYRWVDKDGSTKYTLTPPPKRTGKAVRTVKVDTTPVMASTAPVNNNGQQNPNPNSADAQQTASANAALNGHQPTQNQQANGQGTATPSPNSAAINNTAPPNSVPAAPAITAITPPPANRVIVPTQAEARPVFENP